MKWIGQHIWDFISRFRGYVYMENVPDGTVANDKFLGLDTNNKVVKETVSSGASINGTTANGIATYGGVGQIDIEPTLTYGSHQILHNSVGNDFTVSSVESINIAGGGDAVVDGHTGVFIKKAATTIGEFDTANLKIHATAAGPSSISLQGDLDNGTNTVKIQGPLSVTSNRLQKLQDLDGNIALTSDITKNTETFHFNKRITVSNTSTTTWYGGYPDNSYISSLLYDISTTKSGDNYTDTTGRMWSTNRMCNWMVGSAATVTRFEICGVEQAGATTDITVAIWKVSKTPDDTNQSSDAQPIDFIGEIEIPADADSFRTSVPPAALTSFQSGVNLAAGDGILLCARKTGGGTDGTFWYVRGVVEIEYD